MQILYFFSLLLSMYWEKAPQFPHILFLHFRLVMRPALPVVFSVRYQLVLFSADVTFGLFLPTGGLFVVVRQGVDLLLS